MTSTDARRNDAIAVEKIGGVLKAPGDRKDSFGGFSHALAIFESLSPADPEDANASRSLSIVDVRTRDALADNGRPGKPGPGRN